MTIYKERSLENLSQSTRINSTVEALKKIHSTIELNKSETEALQEALRITYLFGKVFLSSNPETNVQDIIENQNLKEKHLSLFSQVYRVVFIHFVTALSTTENDLEELYTQIESVLDLRIMKEAKTT